MNNNGEQFIHSLPLTERQYLALYDFLQARQDDFVGDSNENLAVMTVFANLFKIGAEYAKKGST
jgi:hypothetical protein